VTLPLTLCLLWLVTANLIGMLPSRDYHWRAAYAMMAVGLPLLVWVTWAGGLLVGALVLAAATSILRWPLIFAWRWVRRRLGRGQ